jgi:probable RNA-binding protein EIF1AD
MSASTKKKHVFQETINNYTLPSEQQTIVKVNDQCIYECFFFIFSFYSYVRNQIIKVKGPRGNNLHDVETALGELFIVTMPVKFRKSVWTKRGDYVIIEPIEEGNKVKAEIIHILTKEHIKYIKSQGVW